MFSLRPVMKNEKVFYLSENVRVTYLISSLQVGRRQKPVGSMWEDKQ